MKFIYSQQVGLNNATLFQQLIPHMFINIAFTKKPPINNVMLYTINRQRNHLWKRSLDLLALNQDPSITCPQREQDKDYPIKEIWLWSHWNLNENSVRIIRLKRYGYEVIYTSMTIHFLIWFPFSNSSVYHLDVQINCCTTWNRNRFNHRKISETFMAA